MDGAARSGQGHPQAGVHVGYRKDIEHKRTKQQATIWYSSSFCSCTNLPQWWTITWKINQMNPFSKPHVFAHGIYHTNRKQTKTLHKGYFAWCLLEQEKLKQKQQALNNNDFLDSASISPVQVWREEKNT